MVPVSFAAIATSLGVLWFFFDPYIPTTYKVTDLPSSQQVIRDPLVCQWSFVILGLLLIGYLDCPNFRYPRLPDRRNRCPEYCWL